MSSPNMSALTLSSESSPQEQNGYSNTNPAQQIRTPSQGPVAILWDIENCPVPSDVRPEDVAGNIRMALRVHPIIKGSAVTIFSAYGDFNAFPRRLREGCQRTGVRLIDVPNGRKDAADKAILVDMFLFALDNPPPSSIMLISGDVDFAPALHILGQRGYTVILVIPSNVGVSSALSNAGRFVWDWSSIVRGEGFVPNSDGFLTGHHVNDEEEAIVYRGMSMIPSQSVFEYNTASISCFPRSHSLPQALNDGSGSGLVSSDPHEMCVQPGDVNGLKAQIVKMIDLCGGCVPLNRVPNEYQKIFGKTLYVSDYGAIKLVNLLRKMADKVLIEGKGQKRFVCIRTTRAGPTTPNLDIAKIDKKGKGVRDEVGSSDEFSDEERVGEEQDLNLDPALEQFKFELQEILVSYSCRIFLGCFEAIYQQRYKKPLDYQRFGVNQLDELFEKLKDVVELQEELVSKRKFLVAAFC